MLGPGSLYEQQPGVWTKWVYKAEKIEESGRLYGYTRAALFPADGYWHDGARKLFLIKRSRWPNRNLRAVKISVRVSEVHVPATCVTYRTAIMRQTRLNKTGTRTGAVLYIVVRDRHDIPYLYWPSAPHMGILTVALALHHAYLPGKAGTLMASREIRALSSPVQRKVRRRNSWPGCSCGFEIKTLPTCILDGRSGEEEIQ